MELVRPSVVVRGCCNGFRFLADWSCGDLSTLCDICCRRTWTQGIGAAVTAKEVLTKRDTDFAGEPSLFANNCLGIPYEDARATGGAIGTELIYTFMAIVRL